MRKGHWLVLGMVVLTACGSEDASVRTAPTNRKPDYFDVKGFLDRQVAGLSRRQPTVEKQVRLRNGTTETTRVAKTDWSKELQIFYQADINKPALRGVYRVSALSSGVAGRAQASYVRKPEAKATVETLTVTTSKDAPTAQVEEIRAFVKQDNALFYSEKKLRLLCKDGNVTAYEVQGVQKLIMFDTVRYSVRTQVLK